MATPVFLQESLAEISDWLHRETRGRPAGTVVCLRVLDPDHGCGANSGERLILDGVVYRHRGHRTWIDLAEILDLRYLTPQPAEPPLLTLRLQVLDRSVSPHAYRPEDRTEKYGADGPYFCIDKLEEPCFLSDYRDALDQVKPRRGDRVLDLGVHRGDELLPLQGRQLQITGIDHCRSALAVARQRFPEASFLCRDLARDDAVDAGARFHLVIAVGTLQSPGLDGKNLFNRLLLHHLEPRAGIILGWPNGRYMDGEIKYGAKVKNYVKPEMSLLVKDLAHYRRVLQKKGFQVQLRGKYYVFLTAVRGV
ncbi:MAG: SAM-dependent methyltransferase [Acidobacteriota bacterium]|nr:SAM-dependent methyltransferase [Acidobacteriota bacterium]